MDVRRVTLTRSLGYGTYSFTVHDTSQLEPAAALAMFTYDYAEAGPNNREMGVEISPWGDRNTANAQFIIQPFYVPENTSRFSVPPEYSPIPSAGSRGAFCSGHRAGQTRKAKTGTVAEHEFTSGVPTHGSESVRMTLYVFRTRRTIQYGNEVVIEKFEFLRKRERPRWPSKLLLAVLTMVCFAASANALSSKQSDLGVYTRPLGCRGGISRWTGECVCANSRRLFMDRHGKGLVRFDGLNFVLIEHSESTTVPFGPVLGLALDANGSLWIRLQGPALMVRDRNGAFRKRYSRFVAGGVRHYGHVHGKNGELLITGLKKGYFATGTGNLRPARPGMSCQDMLYTMIELADGVTGWALENKGSIR